MRVAVRICRDGRTHTLRVIAGQYRSRPLRSLPGLDIRPSADRLRETLFNVLTAGNPTALEGSAWADLYAGTGAVGIEALSRGAASVLFVESGRPSVQLIQENLQSLKIDAGFEVVQGDVGKVLRRWQEQSATFDYIFLDPPYRLENEYQDTLEFLGQSALLKPTTTVIAEHAKHFDPMEGVGDLKKYRKLKQGDAALSFYRKQ
ncbi:MAG TPA: 16S rRNA (guanine(966)-N(2))-methyltransferase RsmD [Terriglobales bacterium]|nr:16S rRNA (guanine(966)-N(2))-methyltransferase RsmD [Terriglobales bacterium]